MKINGNRISELIFRKRAAGMVLAAFLIIVSGCTSDDKKTKPTDKETSGDEFINLTYTEPVERDMKQIMDEGVIRMITRFNSSSYFLHRGEEKGFEFELAKSFADRYNLNLEVVIPREDEHPIDLLNSGRGDFIAANYSVTPEREAYVRFSAPYNKVDQILVTGPETAAPLTIEELSGMKISVREGSSYLKTLRKMKKDSGIDFEIEVLPKIWDTEAVLYALRDGDFQATVTDENILRSAMNHIEGLNPGLAISSGDLIAWAVRSNTTDLGKSMDSFITSHFRIDQDNDRVRRSAFMNVLLRRYFDNRPEVYNVRNYAFGTGYEGVLSPFDDLVKPLADEAGLDWKLVVAIMAQESRFDPYAKSWMGAVGLMQIIPRFSMVEHKYDLYDPETNIREGIRFLNKHMRHYAYMDSTDQIAFSLAAYNVGMGHMADARRLTIDRNRDPNNWDDVAESLLLLMQPRYYQQARHGYIRGIETVNYVRSVMNRHTMYHTLLLFADEDPIRDRIGPLFSSRVNS